MKKQNLEVEYLRADEQTLLREIKNYKIVSDRRDVSDRRYIERGLIQEAII